LRGIWLAGASLVTLAVATPVLADNGAAAAKGNDEPSLVQTLVVTAQRREEAIQDVPVAVSAFSADSLKNQRIEGGQDLLHAVPNVNFARGNFGGFNFQIRGIGTKTVGTSADGGISVHQNDVPLVASALGDGDFFDVERVEVLRGPQGTLFGRNATGGVVNIITNKPTDRYQSEVTAELGNYNAQRLKGFVNVPFSDTFAVRAAVNYLKRDGFATNTYLNQNEDDRDMWSSRLSAQWKPSERLRFNLMWERSREDDNRDRVGKQLCVSDPGKTSVGGVATNGFTQGRLSQGCSNGSLYGASSLGTLNALATLGGIFGGTVGLVNPAVNPNLGVTTSSDLRKWESGIMPKFNRQGDLYELKAEYDLTDSLTVISETSYSTGKYFTKADYNRAIPSQVLNPAFNLPASLSSKIGAPVTGGTVADPQTGTTNRFRTIDYSTSTSRQFSEELRIQSAFKGPLNFSGGFNFVNFKTTTDYYVLSNGLTVPVEYLAAVAGVPYPLDFNANPNGTGANYYDNRTDYRLGAYAGFGELYYKPNDDLKFTAGLRYGVDHKWDIAHGVQLLSAAAPSSPVQTHAFKEWTGRLNVEWTPHLSFTDKTLVYATYSRGYKPGGFNPGITPGLPIPVSFNSEFVDAIEVGAKNVLLNGSLVLNLTGFSYDYSGYQISAIVNRNSVNSNVDAKVQGLEIESIWEPVKNLRVNGTIGYLHTEITNGSTPDQLDLTGGVAGLTVVKALGASNCVAPTAAVATVQALINANALGAFPSGLFSSQNNWMSCEGIAGLTAAGMLPALPTGIDPTGVNINLKGKELPNSPEFTVNIGAQYTYHINDAWRVTPRADFYYQDSSYSRIFNSVHDQLKAYEIVNLSLVVEQPDWGLSVQAYVKNLFDKTYIQDSYLTDASSGLFTNIFIGDPRTYGVAVTKKF
jgi:outer membrane receptor protein involved in Fe transport